MPSSFAATRLTWSSIVSVALAAASTLLPPAEVPLLLLAAVAVGLPHGGLDHVVGRAVFVDRHRGQWWLPFLIGYLGLGLGTLVLWHLLPAVVLGIFLLLSILHFGAEDAQASGDAGLVAVVAHGCVPVVVPALIHPDAVGRLFRLLAGHGGAHVLWLASGVLALVWLSAVVAWVGRSVLERGTRINPFGLAATVFLFVIATPLAAFAIYFAVLHTPRAFRSLHLETGLGGTSGLLRRSLPLAALGMAVGVILFVFQPTHGLDNDVVRTVFLLLSALTVPHMWLRWLASRLGHHVPPRIYKPVSSQADPESNTQRSLSSPRKPRPVHNAIAITSILTAGLDKR